MGTYNVEVQVQVSGAEDEDQAWSRGRVVTATIEGRTYDIPEIWVIGFTSKPAPWAPEGPRATIQDAVAWWHYQTELEEASK